MPQHSGLQLQCEPAVCWPNKLKNEVIQTPEILDNAKTPFKLPGNFSNWECHSLSSANCCEFCKITLNCENCRTFWYFFQTLCSLINHSHLSHLSVTSFRSFPKKENQNKLPCHPSMTWMESSSISTQEPIIFTFIIQKSDFPGRCQLMAMSVLHFFNQNFSGGSDASESRA